MAKNMEKNGTELTNRLLMVIIALLLRRKDEALLPLNQQIAILHDLGLRPTEMAQILGRSSTYINKELSGIRKRNQ